MAAATEPNCKTDIISFMSQAIAMSSSSSSAALSPDVLKATAKAAKLRYVFGPLARHRRERTDRGFEYFDAKGARRLLMRKNSAGSASWRFRRPTRMSGSVPSPTAIFRPPAATLGPQAVSLPSALAGGS
jgi:hypothetical protein